jgi:hypothetical protein
MTNPTEPLDPTGAPEASILTATTDLEAATTLIQTALARFDRNAPTHAPAATVAVLAAHLADAFTALTEFAGALRQVQGIPDAAPPHVAAAVLSGTAASRNLAAVTALLIPPVETAGG